ncbi:MAG TPA: hypothetical protein VEK15_12280 [Vicinamibacteria bacterium]|nr:hypothetical protein [Vicinamibacteria bacterium]
MRFWNGSESTTPAAMVTRSNLVDLGRATPMGLDELRAFGWGNPCCVPCDVP